MSESKIQVSFKLPNGTIPLFRGDTIDEVEKLMQDAALSATFVGSMEAFAEACGIGKPSPQQTTPTQAISTVVNTLGATLVSNGGGATRHCLHGKMTAIEGNGKFGLYKGFFCAAPKGATDKCATVYLKPKDADYNKFVPDRVAK